MKRSSRRRPRSTASWSGAIAAGLEFQHDQGGDRRVEGRVRQRGARAGTCSASAQGRAAGPRGRARPRRCRCRSAGRRSSRRRRGARRPRARAGRRRCGRRSARRSGAGRRCRVAAAPAAWSRSRARRRRSVRRHAAELGPVLDRVLGQPREQLVVAVGVRAAPVLVARPASTIARIIPSASAASVPGSGVRCSSATRAVRLRKGSTTTSRAPARRASRIFRHRCGAVDIGFQPQATIMRAWCQRSGSTSGERPIVRSTPRTPAEAQIVRTSSLAPSAFISRCAHRPALQQAHRAHIAVGEERLAAVALDRRADAGGGRVERLVPGRLAELRRALRPGSDQRMEQAVVRVHAVGVVGDLAAEKAGSERVIGIAARRPPRGRPARPRAWRRYPDSRADTPPERWSCGDASARPKLRP